MSWQIKVNTSNSKRKMFLAADYTDKTRIENKISTRNQYIKKIYRLRFELTQSRQSRTQDFGSVNVSDCGTGILRV